MAGIIKQTIIFKNNSQKPNLVVGFKSGRSYLRKTFWILFAGLSLLVWNTTYGQSQQHITRSWTPEDGLPSNVINSIYQTEKGYLWIGTYNGLAHFNGTDFKIFETSQHPEISSSLYSELYEDSNGTLWIGSSTPYLIAFTDGIDNYEITDLSDQGPDNAIGSIAEDNQGHILFTTRYGVYRKSDNQVRQLYDGFEFSNLEKLDNGEIYLVLQNKIGVWSGAKREGKPQIFAKILGENRFRIGEQIIDTEVETGKLLFRDIQSLPGGRLLLYTSEGFLIYSDTDYNWISFRDLGIETGNSLFVQGHTLWLASRNGTYRMRVAGDEITNVRQLTTSNDNVAYQDREGSIWIGTANKGIRQLVQSPFKIYSKSDGLASNAMLAVLEDSRGRRWIGTNCEGLHKIASQGNKLYDVTQGMAAECVWSLAETGDGKIWASDREVVFYDPGTDRFKPAPFSDQLKESRYRALFEDSQNQLWLGTLGEGLARWNGKQLEYFTTAEGLPTNEVRMMYEDDSQVLWIATEKGIAKISELADPHPQKLKAAGNYYYRAIMKDKRGLFWFGSYGDGITIYNPQNGDTTRVTANTGLDENVVSQIAEDEQGNIWLGGNRGIYVLPANSVRQFLNDRSSTINTIAYGTDDGLLTAETSGGFQPSWQFTSEGTILFSTVNGLVEIDPSSFRKNNTPPPVYLEKVLINNSPVPDSKPLTFSYSDRRIQFRYSVLSYKNPDQIQVEYRMEGFDGEWQRSDGSRQTTYTSLPPGEYTFKMRVAGGQWNESAIALPVSVNAPFWQEAWFITGIILLFGGMIYGAFRLRITYLRNRSKKLEKQVRERTNDLNREKQMVEEKNQVIARQNQQLEELNRMKDRFIAGISHEFRTPLTLIFGSIEMAEEKLKEANPEEIEEQLERIGTHSEKLRDLIDQFLELSKLEAGMSVMHKSTICLTKFSAGITAAFTSLAEQKKIDYQIDLPEDTVWIEADHAKLEMAVNNILKNAFKFTDEGGTITYRLESYPKKEQTTIVITDTGRGIDRDEQEQIFNRFYQAGNQSGGSGIGLAVAKEIIELHKGTISLDSQKGKGSAFKIKLPLLDLNLTGQETNALLEKMRSDSQDEEAKPAESEKNSEDAKQILVIEDNPELRTFIRKRLSDTYAVIEAADGKEGLQAAKKHLPDLVICDVMMPNMDGYTFCRKLRKDPEIRFLPVILLTARAGKEDEITGLEAGADDYIQKPFDTKVLRARVDNLIRLRMELREKYQQDGLPISLDLSDDTSSFRQKVDKVLNKRLSDPDFSVRVLADEIGLSRRQLLRKCKKVLDKTPTEYIRHSRLRAASELLKKRDVNISEVAYAVGFNNLSLFSQYFKEWSGKLPSSFQNKD